MYNGELYNFKEIREELAKLGCNFKTSSDTEVLFFALRQWKEDAIRKLNGMFSFVWIDKENGSFLLSRDRMGIKPLFYAFEKKSLIFASEIDSIVRLAEGKPVISKIAIESYLSLQYVPTPLSILEGINKLPPGYFLKGSIKDLINQVTIQAIPYWDAFHGHKQVVERQANELEMLLKDSVERQLISDVPLGLFLSSGVDSSLLGAIINKYFPDQVFNFFTIGFEEETFADESSDAKIFLDGFHNSRFNHHKMRISSKFLLSKLESQYTYFDEPFGDPASILNLCVSQKAKEYVTVVLSGDGADELFWGYTRYSEWANKMDSCIKSIKWPDSFRKNLNSGPFPWLRYTISNAMENDGIRTYFDMLRPRQFGFLPSVVDNKKLWFARGIEQISVSEKLPSLIDLKTYLPDAMLFKVGRASMAMSVEVRVPYLDNNIIEYSLDSSLSSNVNCAYNGKRALRELLLKLAPHYPNQKVKKGFSFPLGKWLRLNWRDLAVEVITKERLNDLGMEDKNFIRITNDFFRFKSNSVYEVWYLLNLLLWYDNFKRKHSSHL